MGKCIKIPRKQRQVCIGSLNHPIEIDTRAIRPPADGSVDATELFTSIGIFWAKVKTVNGVEIFDGTNKLKGIATHEITIRYQDGITEEAWIKLIDNRYLDVIDTEIFEEDDLFILMRCQERGTTSKAANFA